jgi:tetrahydromethanopterin S-methyltransferase subunit G
MNKEHNTPKAIGGDNIQANIGDNADTVAVGKDIHQEITERSETPVTQADIAEVRGLFSELKHIVEMQAPSDKKASAVERVKELEETVTAEETDTTTVEYVTKWFGRNLPKIAGAVVGVLVNPVVGKVAGATGELVAEELKRRYEQK